MPDCTPGFGPADTPLTVAHHDLLAEAELAALSTWDRYQTVKMIMTAASGLFEALPTLPHHLEDSLRICVHTLVDYISNERVDEFLYEDMRYLYILEGLDVPDEWMLQD